MHSLLNQMVLSYVLYKKDMYGDISKGLSGGDKRH